MITDASYNPLQLLKHSQLSTIYPALFRRVEDVHYKRERIRTPDNDFLDLDWSKVGSHRCVIVGHGLEGNSELAYVKGVVKMANSRKWDAVAMNYRGCSGEPNRLYQSYHIGATEDVKLMVEHVIKKGNYKEVFLVGFSLGGNLALKYAGEEGHRLPSEIGGVVAISVPCDVEVSAYHLMRPAAYLYRNRFLGLLKEKLKTKLSFPEVHFTLEDVNQLKTFEEYDGMYTVPAFGFSNVKEFWRYSSSKHYVPGIRVPTLILNALNDPLLTEDSHPIKESAANPFVKLMLTKYGGHVGFYDTGNKLYWHEQQILQFLMRQVGKR